MDDTASTNPTALVPSRAALSPAGERQVRPAGEAGINQSPTNTSELMEAYGGWLSRAARKWGFRHPQHERLREAIEVAGAELSALSADDQKLEWCIQARLNLDSAIHAWCRRDYDRAWGLVHLAQELQVCGFDGDRVTAVAVSLRYEISTKRLGTWRQSAMLEQLDRVLTSKPTPHHLVARRVWLKEALHTRNQGFETEHFNIAILRRYQVILLSVALIILAVTLVGSLFVNERFDQGVNRSWVVVGAALSGALGGITSALQRTTRRNIERVTTFRLVSLSAALSRPLLGAIAGVSVFLAMRAGITPQLKEQQIAYLFMLSFGAGFSERLVVKDPREDAGLGVVPLPLPPRPSRGENSNGGGTGTEKDNDSEPN